MTGTHVTGIDNAVNRAPGRIRTADHLVRSWPERSTSSLDEIVFVVRSKTYVTTAAGTSLQVSPLITIEHYRLPQNSRKHLVTQIIER
jgi:hypothetical protein